MIRPTINDVARVAGVSKGTVSRFLNSNPKVSVEAREAITRAIGETGYRTNAMARSLATGTTHAIAVLVAGARGQLFSDPTFAELIEGVHEGMADSDMSMVILLGGTEAEDHRTLSYVRGGHVDGLIHLNPYVTDPITEGLASSPLPLVLCGPRPDLPLPQRHWVATAEDTEGVNQALGHLASRGARTIAMVAGEPRGVSAGRRFQAYRDWSGAGFEPDLVEAGDYSEESGRVALERLLDRRPDIDAVFCASDRMAIGALTTARRRGLRVPDDLLVVGFDDQRIAETADPPLTTIRQPIRGIGRGAVGILREALATGTSSDKIFPTELVVRASA